MLTFLTRRHRDELAHLRGEARAAEELRVTLAEIKEHIRDQQTALARLRHNPATETAVAILQTRTDEIAVLVGVATSAPMAWVMPEGYPMRGMVR